MPKLSDFLWRRWLRKTAGGKFGSGEFKPDEALLSRALERDEKVREMRATMARRAAIHRRLKVRNEAKNRLLLEQKREIKRLGLELERAQAWNRQLKEHLGHLEALARGRLLTPCMAVAPKPLGANPAFLERLAWRYWMRLGVLFQYEPRPVAYDRLPVGKLPDEDLPVISVVTPSFNQAQYLGETISSILTQEYPKLQWVVMDGGSNDGSPDLIRAVEKNTHFWQSAPDGGLAASLNKGFAHTDGEIMAWLNSDDTYCPGTLRQVGEYFARHPEVDAIYGHRIIINSASDEVGRWVLPPHDPVMLRWNDYVPQETLFWRRSLWEKSGGRIDESFQFSMDWDLLLRFQRAGAHFRRLPWFLGCFRAHKDQKSQTLIHTTGAEDNARLRERELGSFFSEYELQRRVNRFQLRAIMETKLLKAGWRR